MVDNLITLYEDSETDFLSNGLGGLRDATKCMVYEEINGEYELTMNYPTTGRHYSDLVLRRLIFAKPDPYRDAQPFRIYDISKPHNGVVTISAHHLSYDLSGYPIAPFTASGLSDVMDKLNSQMTRAFNNNKPSFYFSHQKNDISTVLTLTTPSSAKALLGGTEDSVLDTYHGEYEWDRWNVILHTRRGANRGVRIAYGRNLTSLEQEENCDDVWTGVYPYWYSESSNKSVLVELSTGDDKILYCQGDYKHERILILDLSSEFESKPTPAQLRERAQEYIDDNEIGTPKVSLTVSFVNRADLKILEQVMLGDTVPVDFPEMGVSSTSRVISTTYNVLTNKYETIELGDAKSNLATTIASQGLNIAAAKSGQNTMAISDFGFDQTDSTGRCVVSISNDISELIPDSLNYAVFLQKEGSGDLWVSERTKESFAVQGTANLNFTWEIKI